MASALSIKKLSFIVLVFLVSLLAGFSVVQLEALAILLWIMLAISLLILGVIFKNPFWGVILLFFFIPFERIPTIDAFGVTLRINQFLGFLTLSVWLLKIFFERYTLKFNWANIALIFYLISAFISTDIAFDKGRSLQVFIFILFVFLLSFVIQNLIDNQDKLKKVVWIILLTSFIASIFGLYQFFGDLVGLPTGLDPGYQKAIFGFPRIQSFAQEPLYFANFLFLPLGLIIALIFLGKEQEIKKPILFLLLALFFINFVLTLSRGAYLAFGVFALVFFFFQLKKIFLPQNFLYPVLGILVVFLLIAAIFNQLGPESKARFLRQATAQDVLVERAGESAFGRIESYKRALEAYQENPILGIGLGNYGPWNKGYPPKPEGRGWDIVNNQYLEILAEQGLVGLITFLFFGFVLILRALVAYFKAKTSYTKAILIALLAATLATFVQYNFFSTLYIIPIWLLIGLLQATSSLALKEVKTL